MKLVLNRILGNRGRVGGMAALGLGLVIVAVTGCATSQYRSEAQTEQDRALAQTVTDTLAASTVYKYSGVNVTADGGKVHLNGVVPTLAQKRAAADLAARVPGVVTVDNRLSVQPLPGTPEYGFTLPRRPP